MGRAVGGMPASARKRKVAAVVEEEVEEVAPSPAAASQPAPPQAVIDAETADKLASKLCRYGPRRFSDSRLYFALFLFICFSACTHLLAFSPCAVILHEHLRKPIPRVDLKKAVMSEYDDRSGKVFKQVLEAANTKLYEAAGLKLVAEGAAGSNAADDDLADAPGGSQAGPSQSQAVGGSSQAATQGGGASQAAGALRVGKSGTSYLLVNKLPDPIRSEPPDGPALHLAFVEVVLNFIQQSEGVLDEEKLFTYLAQIGLERKECLPPPAEQEKVETLVQKRLVSETWLRRQKKPNDADQYVYVAGARAELSRNVRRADECREALLSS